MRTQKDRNLKGVWKNETETNWNGVTYERSNGRKKPFIKKKNTEQLTRETEKLEEKIPPLTEKFFFTPCCCCTGAPGIAKNKNYRRSTASRRENRLDLEAMAKRKRAKGGRRSYDCAVMAWQVS